METFIELLNDTLHETNLIIASIPDGVWQFLAFTAAATAAIGAFLSARATRIAAQGQLFSNLLTRYSSEDMREALLKMGELYKARLKDGDRVFRERVKTIVGNRSKAKSSKGIDSCRRQVSHFFQTVLRLYENKETIDKAFFQHICKSCSGFKLLYAVVEHFEVEIGKETNGYNRDIFTRLLRLSGRSDIQELEKLRPSNKGP